MTTLLVDLGNTRIKWARLGPDGPGRMHAAVHDGWRTADFRRALFGADGGGVDRGVAAVRVLAVSVAAPALRRRFSAAVRAATGRAPRFCRSERQAAGVANGYREVWRLGSDRWVALIGARRCEPGRAVCVVDVGTATTIDLLGADGRHHGGAILPGPELMIDALLRDTGGIRRRARGQARAGSMFARDTRSALAAGAVHATAAAIERALRQARDRPGMSRARLLLTGGGAARIARELAAAHRRVPDLVLQGLAALALARRPD